MQSQGLYFEDLEIGQRFRSHGRSVTEHDIISFCTSTGVYEELHLNLEYIKTRSVFGGRVAPGILTLALAEGLATQIGLIHDTGMALLEMNVKIPRPVRCNDTLAVEVVVADKRPTSKPDRGVVTFDHLVRNQRDQVVMEIRKVRLIRRR